MVEWRGRRIRFFRRAPRKRTGGSEGQGCWSTLFLVSDWAGTLWRGTVPRTTSCFMGLIQSPHLVVAKVLRHGDVTEQSWHGSIQWADSGNRLGVNTQGLLPPCSMGERARLPRWVLRKMPLEVEGRGKRHLLPGWGETSKTMGQMAQGNFPKGGLRIPQVHSTKQQEHRGTNWNNWDGLCIVKRAIPWSAGHHASNGFLSPAPPQTCIFTQLKVPNLPPR